MAHDVFISYSNKDKAVADAICAKLEREGIRCWYAPRDIAPGASWAGSIIEAIEQTRVMILVFTDFSNASRQVLREVNNAVRTGAVIVPFRLTSNAPTDDMRYYLSTVHWLDAMNEPLEMSIEQLSEVTLSILSGTPEKLKQEDSHTGTNLHDQNPVETDPASRENPAVAVDDAGEGAAPLKKETYGQAADQHQKPRHSGSKSGSKKWIPAACITAVLLVAVCFGISRINQQKEPATSQSSNTVTSADSVAPVETAPERPTASAAVETAESVTDESVPDSSSTEDSSTETIDLDNYIYKVYSQTATIQKYFGTDESVVTVPAVIDGLPVTTIDENCFENHTEIERIILPDTVSTIGYHAFYGCTKLSELNFPSALRKIGGWAFAYTSLTEAILPGNLKTLDYGAFNSNIRLESAVLPEGVDSIGENTFRGCARLKSVTILAPDPDIHINAFEHDSGVTLIGIPGGYTEKYCRAAGLTFEKYQG